jgi:hypothetical protein
MAYEDTNHTPNLPVSHLQEDNDRWRASLEQRIVEAILCNNTPPKPSPVMDTTNEGFTKKDIARLGKSIYFRRIQREVEPEHYGQYEAGPW